MKNKKMLAKLIALNLSLAMVISVVPVRAENEFISHAGHVNMAKEKTTNNENAQFTQGGGF